MMLKSGRGEAEGEVEAEIEAEGESEAEAATDAAQAVASHALVSEAQPDLAVDDTEDESGTADDASEDADK